MLGSPYILKPQTVSQCLASDIDRVPAGPYTPGIKPPRRQLLEQRVYPPCKSSNRMLQAQIDTTYSAKIFNISKSKHYTSNYLFKISFTLTAQ